MYINPPDKAIVIVVDEKPMVQVLERKSGYIATRNHKIIRGLHSTHKRHRTNNLFSTMEVVTRLIREETTYEKKRFDFFEFTERIIQ